MVTSLENKKEVVICPADKVGGLVVMSKTFSTDEMCRLLSDRDTYQLLHGDPKFKYNEELHHLIKHGKEKKILTKKEALYLDPVSCWTLIIYFLPKTQGYSGPSG